MQLLYDHLEISRRVKNLGREISSAYKGCDLVVAGILKGGFIFMADLVRQIDLPMEIDFARLSSYQNADTPQGAVKIIQDITTNISGRHVLLVDDILDTGQSLKAYRQHLETRHPASVRICTMIDKSSRRSASIKPDFYGFNIDDGFIVGYGLDYAEKYRSLPDIHILDPQDRR